MKLFAATGACALLIGAAACVTAAPASACPYGTVPSDYSGVCISGGTNGGGQVPTAPESGAAFGAAPGQLPSVDGIPCTPQQIGTCIGLSESAR